MPDEELKSGVEKKREIPEAILVPEKKAAELQAEIGRAPIEENKLDEAEVNPLRVSFLDKIRSMAEVAVTKVEKIKNRVKAALGGSPEAIRILSPAERVGRDLETATVSEKLRRGEKLSEGERKAAAAMIERRNWGKLFSLKENDIVVSFLVPGGDFLSIKNMNDNVFGYQGTDEIIAYRRQLLGKYLKEAGLEELEQDYLSGFFRLAEKDRSGMVEKLEAIAGKLDAEMKKYILEKVAERKAEEKDGEKLEKIKKFEERLIKAGYRMTFGVSTVEKRKKKNDFSNVELAMDRSLQMAQLGRASHDNYGREFSEAVALDEIGKIEKLRDEIIQNGNRIVSAEGMVFDPIFTRNASGNWELSRDILRDVRKYKFKVAEGDKENEKILEKVSLYVRRLNLFDIRKPFTHDETSGVDSIQDSGVKVGQELELQKKLAEKLRTGELSRAEALKASEILDQDPKDRLCTSKEKFASGALKIKNCSYITLDRLDLGVDLLRSYEQLQQNVFAAKERGENPAEALRQASVSAGDDITRAMRDVRGMVLEEFKKFFPGEEFLTLVGGDEITLAMDNDRVPAEKVDEFLLVIQNKTKSRVIRTVETHRSSEDLNERARQEHVDALKRAEHGADTAKDIESSLSKLKLLLSDKVRWVYPAQPTTEELLAAREEITSALEGVVEKLGLTGYIIVEREKEADGKKEHVFALKTSSGEKDPNEVVGQLKALISQLPKRDTLTLEEVSAIFDKA